MPSEHLAAFGTLFGDIRPTSPDVIPEPPMRIGALVVEEASLLGGSSAAEPIRVEPVADEQVESFNWTTTIGQLELSEVEKYLLGLALGGKKLKVSELKVDGGLDALLTPIQRLDFAPAFRSMLLRINKELEKRGIHAQWKKVGRTRGRTYELQIRQPITEQDISVVQESAQVGAPPRQEYDADETAQADPVTVIPRAVPDMRDDSPEARLAKSRARREGETAAARFTERLLDGIHEIVNNGDTAKNRLNYVVAQIAANLEIPREEASTLIEDLIRAGLLFRGKPNKGAKTISFEELEADRVRRTSTGATTGNLEPEPFGFSEADREVTGKILTYIAKTFTYVEQGATFAELYRALTPEMNGGDFRRLVRRIQSRGMLVLSNEGKYGRARKGTIIKLPTAEMKKGIRLDPNYVSNLLKDFEAES